MTPPIRLAIHGASGRMGRALLALLCEDARCQLVGAVVSAGSVHLGALEYGEQANALRYSHELGKGEPEVVIDFSGPNGLSVALDYCAAHKVALVTGTTGIDATLQAKLYETGKQTALLHAANFSLGIAVLKRLLREAATSLPDWDLEIVEAHHGHKEDAPSGTALALGEAAAAARGTSLAKDAVYAREGRPGARRHGSIGFAVVRGGDVVGEHTALLLGHGERVELSHRATERSIFARGALEAAIWLAGKKPGAYAMDDILQDRLAAGRT